MLRIYIDEAGRITRKYKENRYFVIAYVLTKDCKSLHKCFRKARLEAVSDHTNIVRSLEEKQELKGSNVNELVKSKIYNKLLNFHKGNKTFEIALVVVDNKNLQTMFRKKQSRSFNYFIAWAMKIFSQETSFVIDDPNTLLLIDDRNVAPTSKSSLQDFLNMQLQFNDNLFKHEIHVSYFDSKNEQLIQLADLIANTTLRALNTESVEAKENLNLLSPLLTGGKVFEFESIS